MKNGQKIITTTEPSHGLPIKPFFLKLIYSLKLTPQ